LAARLRPVEGTRQIAGIAPNDDVEPMRARLAKESKSLILVGHHALLESSCRTAAGAACVQVLRFGMGGVVRLERDQTEQWLIRWMLTPECKPRTALRLRRVAGAHDDGQARVFRKRRVAGRALAEVEPRAPYRFNLPRVEAVGA
jgi:hypothetical protein